MSRPQRVAILGMGHRLRRDDGLGPELCDRLQAALAGDRSVLVVDGGPAPENCVGVLRAFRPDRVVVVDAARMGSEPGTVRWLSLQEPAGIGTSTHTLPLPMFCEYIQGSLGCEVRVLGIEPGDTSFGEGLTTPVELAVERLAAGGLAVFSAWRPARQPGGGEEEQSG